MLNEPIYTSQEKVIYSAVDQPHSQYADDHTHIGGEEFKDFPLSIHDHFKKYESHDDEESPVVNFQHVVLNEPIYTSRKKVIYSAVDQPHSKYADDPHIGGEEFMSVNEDSVITKDKLVRPTHKILNLVSRALPLLSGERETFSDESEDKLV